MIRSILAAASEANNERDITDSINEYFDDFEYKVYTNRVAQIDKRIPLLIIGKFKRLFEMWDENIILSKFLEDDSFREIFISMHNVFGKNFSQCSTSSCYLECERCGEEIILRNNDPDYSYRLHETSKYHVEFIRNLKSIGREQESDVIFSQNTNNKGSFLECHLCWVSIPIANRNKDDVFTDHQLDKKHQANIEIYNSSKSHIKVHSIEEKLYVCSCCEEIYHVDLLMDHLKSSMHRENLAKAKHTDQNNLIGIQNADFDIFKTNMKLIHVNEEAVRCLLCESNLTSMNMVMEHLTSKTHTQNLEKYIFIGKRIEKADAIEDFALRSYRDYQRRIMNDINAEKFHRVSKLNNYMLICCLIVVFLIFILHLALEL